jgi:putative ABC transport system permease protein
MNLINIRSTFNHLKNNKFHSLLNIFGLAVGLLFFFQLISYISYEKSYDSVFSNSDRIYRVNYDVEQNGQNVLHSAKTPDRLFRIVKDEIPEVEYSAVAYLENVLLRYGDKQYCDQPDLWVNGDFAKIFNFEMVAGRARLEDKLTCIISKSMADNIFGKEDPVGKTVYINEGMPHEVTGVFKDLPSNSHIHFNIFMSMATFIHYQWMSPEGGWQGDFCWTYLKLKEGADPKKLDAGLKNVSDKYLTHLANQQRKGTFVSQPLSMVHYVSGRTGELGISTREKTVSALMLIAGLILMVIWMNYVNLSTALSRKRLNVFATFRKLGASRFELVKLSLIESAMINISAVAGSVMLYFLTRNLFARLIGLNLSQGFVNFPIIIGITAFMVLAGVVVTSFISSVPALKVNPALLQQKKMSKKSGTQFLVGLQFFMSCFLVLCSLMVTKQINFMQKADLGVKLDQVIVLKGAASTNIHPQRRELFNAFRDEVLRSSGFVSGTATMNVPGQPLRFRNNNISIPGKQGELKQSITIGNIDNGYIETYGLKLLAGENFDNLPRLDSAKVLVSESTVKILGYHSPAEAIGQQISMDGRNRTIKGVVNDFHHEGLKKATEPMLFTHEHPYEFGFYSFRIKGDAQQALATLTKIWPKHYPNDPLDTFFSDEYFNQQYNEEMRLSKILSAFTLFAIIVASLGLFGLVSFIAQQRTKEIGVRKVNGATVGDIVLMVFSYFTRFEVTAFLLACPLAWFVIERWLQGFAYKTSFSWWIFLLTGAIAFLISIVSVVTQTYKAATRNPVEALRYE